MAALAERFRGAVTEDQFIADAAHRTDRRPVNVFIRRFRTAFRHGQAVTAPAKAEAASQFFQGAAFAIGGAEQADGNPNGR
jgi:hypothetical protein